MVFRKRSSARVALLPATACLLLAGCKSGKFPQYPSNYREYAYVADAGGNSVAVLDIVNMREQAAVQVGPRPVALAASPVRNEIYVVSQGTGTHGTFAILDAETNSVVATLPLAAEPSALAVSPDGRRVYVANAASNNVSVIDTDSRKIVGLVGVGEGPDALAVAPDSATVVVANGQGGSVTVLDNRLGTLPVKRQVFGGCPGAKSVVVLPDSSQAFAACSAGHQVLAVGLETHGANSSQPDRVLALLDVGQQPVHLAMKPDGGEIFVSNAGSDSVSEIATGSDEVGGAALIGGQPVFGVVSSDNSLLWTANESADTIAAYSILDGKLINTVHVGAGPSSLAFSASGNLLLATDTRSGDVSVIRTFSRNLHREAVYGTLFTLLPAGSHPVAVVDKAFLLKH